MENSPTNIIERALSDALLNRIGKQHFALWEDPEDNKILNNLKSECMI